MTRTETTSKRVASIAAKILRASPWESATRVCVGWAKDAAVFISVADLRALAASALTQHEKAKEAKALRAGKIPKGHRLIKRHAPVSRRNGAAKP